MCRICGFLQKILFDPNEDESNLCNKLVTASFYIYQAARKKETVCLTVGN